MFNPFRRVSPEEKERARLAALLKDSRNIEGTLTEASGTYLYFTYEVRGVTYHATQDVSAIEGADIDLWSQNLGPVTVRYSTNNPANSMVLATDWSGLNRNPLRGTKSYAEPNA